MAALVVLVVGVAIFDGTRRLDASIDRLAARHQFLAFVIAQDVSSRLGLLQQDERLTAPTLSPAEIQRRALHRLLSHLREVQKRGSLTILLRETDGFGFHTADGRVVSSPALERALDAHRDSIVLAAKDANAVGLPARRAVAGFAWVREANGFPALRIAVLSSGQEEADRYRAARRRTTFTVGAVAVIFLGFGALMLRQQRRSLELSAELERADLASARDAELARADRFAMLATMSSGIAHELGGPLTILYGRHEQLAALAATDPAAQRAHTAMGEQLGRVRALVRGFMALARGEPPTLTPTSPRVLVTEARELVQHRFARAGVHLEVTLEDESPSVICDAPLFVQALVNLLVNACQASPVGARVQLRVARREERVAFEVDDEGEGIDSAVAASAHAPFFTTRAQAGGTGLGLAIANEITQQHRGTLCIAARPSGGTHASIELPIA